MNLHIIILAAGKGTRMYASNPKVLHLLGGKSLLEHVISTAKMLHPKKIHIVYGGDGELVKKQLQNYDVNWIEQAQRLGTGHAVMQALPKIEQGAQVLILYGDVPLITQATLERLIKTMPADGLNILTAEFNDPTGLGRIIRDNLGEVSAIVEDKDTSPAERQIKEINSGILVTTSKILRNYLPRLNKNNAQGEYYLTDIISLLHKDNVVVDSLLTDDPQEISGVNDKKQLADLERLYQKKIANRLMHSGLTLMDPNRFDLRGELKVGRDVVIDINVIVEGKVTIGNGVMIGSNNYLKNVKIGNNIIVKANCVIEDAVISDNCTIGPFARIRPGSHLASGVRIGNFVEVKNSRLGRNSKANHLSYVGDAVIGKDVNVGAGTITCNYDGVHKYKTVIEDGTFVGSNTSLVAPVKLGKKSVIGAGSVITENAPANKLTLARSRQVTIKDWRRKKKK